jgi:hypothetical protein
MEDWKMKDIIWETANRYYLEKGRIWEIVDMYYLERGRI